jgi:heme-degrading monooxygenase HmoA
MFVLMGRYRVGDLDRFHAVFEGFEATRRAQGATGHRLLGSVGDPTRFVVLIDFATREAAERFATGAERIAALAQAGVIEHEDEILEDAAR